MTLYQLQVVEAWDEGANKLENYKLRAVNHGILKAQSWHVPERTKRKYSEVGIVENRIILVGTQSRLDNHYTKVQKGVFWSEETNRIRRSSAIG